MNGGGLYSRTKPGSYSFGTLLRTTCHMVVFLFFFSHFLTGDEQYLGKTCPKQRVNFLDD